MRHRMPPLPCGCEGKPLRARRRSGTDRELDIRRGRLRQPVALMIQRSACDRMLTRANFASVDSPALCARRCANHDALRIPFRHECLASQPTRILMHRAFTISAPRPSDARRHAYRLRRPRLQARRIHVCLQIRAFSIRSAPSRVASACLSPSVYISVLERLGSSPMKPDACIARASRAGSDALDDHSSRNRRCGMLRCRICRVQFRHRECA